MVRFQAVDPLRRALSMRRQGSGTSSRNPGCGIVLALRFVAVTALQPNLWMELTIKSPTPFARGRAKAEPLLSASHPSC